MSLYCMCEADNDKPDSQAFGAPNRYCATESTIADVPDVGFPPLALRKPMTCIKTGAPTATPAWRRMKSMKTFWMVWNPNRQLPAYQHGSLASARTEAERLARMHEPAEFVILQAVEGRKADRMQVINYESDEIPDGKIPF